MAIVTTTCVVLQTFPYSDTSKILRLMTRDFGPKSAIARGALRPRSKFGGLIESFSDGIATLYLKENRDLHTLSDFELVADRRGLAADLARFAGASVLCELVMRMAPEQRDEPLFSALRSGSGPSPQRSLERTSWSPIGLWGLVRLSCNCSRHNTYIGAQHHYAAEEPAT